MEESFSTVEYSDIYSLIKSNLEQSTFAQSYIGKIESGNKGLIITGNDKLRQIK